MRPREERPSDGLRCGARFARRRRAPRVLPCSVLRLAGFADAATESLAVFRRALDSDDRQLGERQIVLKQPSLICACSEGDCSRTSMGVPAGGVRDEARFLAASDIRRAPCQWPSGPLMGKQW